MNEHCRNDSRVVNLNAGNAEIQNQLSPFPVNSCIVGQKRKNSFNQTQKKIGVRDGVTESVIFNRTSGDVPKFDARLRNDINFLAALSQSPDGVPNSRMKLTLTNGEAQRKICVGQVNHG